MDFSKCKTINGEWKTESKSTLLSPAIDEHWEHIILWPDSKDDNYAIETNLTLVHGQTLDSQLFKEAGVIIRYTGKNEYYYAGVGGFGARTFIGMIKKEDDKYTWNRLASQGRKDELEFNRPYKLRVECNGSKISLYVDGKNRLTVEVDEYPTGYFGFRTVRTQARFAGIGKRGPSVSRVFVIMPFTTSLNFVYEVIEEVVKGQGMMCYRVDESATSKSIIDDIKEWLTNADLIIADLTGKNPNVYYETGFAHALNKKLILIAQSQDDLAFNVRPIRTLFYESPEELRKELEKAIEQIAVAERSTDSDKD